MEEDRVQVEEKEREENQRASRNRTKTQTEYNSRRREDIHNILPCEHEFVSPSNLYQASTSIRHIEPHFLRLKAEEESYRGKAGVIG